MTTTIKALANLSRRVARAFHRLYNRLTRKAAFTCTITVAVPPFLKMEVGYKADLGKPANDNHRRPRPRRSA
ncbi:MAG TPA: hypothetical protein VFE31_09975 [Opitutaceae bacterium]|jgi:hypothetical protein|nr:hypothetical protein [Opitutaceae bacterium]